MKLTNKQLMILLIPVALLFIGFALYNILPSSEENSTNRPAVSKEDILPDPFATDTSERLNNKKDIYAREEFSNTQKEKVMNDVASDNDFFNSELESPKPVEETTKSPEFGSMDDRISKSEVKVEEKKPLNNNEAVVKPKATTVKKKPKAIEEEKTYNKIREFDNEGNLKTSSTSNTSKINNEPEEEIQPVRKGFYSAGGKANVSNQAKDVFVKAVVHNEQKIKSGDPLKIRFTQEILIGGIVIPANTVVTGLTSFSNDRVKVVVSSINYNNKIIPATLEIFDQDGIPGIYIPGGVNQDIVNQSISNAGQGVRVTLPVIGSVSTGAIKKKVQDPIVIINSGYKVIVKVNK